MTCLDVSHHFDVNSVNAMNTIPGNKASRIYLSWILLLLIKAIFLSTWKAMNDFLP